MISSTVNCKDVEPPNETVEKLSAKEQHGGFYALFFSVDPSIGVDFTNVVDQGKQLPLHIYPGFRANGEVI